MADYEKLRQAMESNFRLGILHARDIGFRLNHKIEGATQRLGQMTEKLDQVTEKLDLVTKQMVEVTREFQKTSKSVEAVGKELSEFGVEVQQGFEIIADDQQKVLDVLLSIGDGSVDLRKELAELKARVEALEKRAS